MFSVLHSGSLPSGNLNGVAERIPEDLTHWLVSCGCHATCHQLVGLQLYLYLHIYLPICIYIAHSSRGQKSEVKVLPGGHGLCRGSSWAPILVSSSFCDCWRSASLGLWLHHSTLCLHLCMVFSALLCILVMMILVITFRAYLTNPGYASPLSHIFCRMQ